MEQKLNKPKGRQPDFRSDGCAIWINEDRNGKQYLSVKVVGHNSINVFKHEPKQEPVRID